MISKAETETVLNECLSREQEFLSLLEELVNIETPPADAAFPPKAF
ncbi:MAG: hypothetical protein U5K72_14635 [Balneolaceae bacterium]|nr:hypothetical protein [Balneolaceae bacterium]